MNIQLLKQQDIVLQMLMLLVVIFQSFCVKQTENGICWMVHVDAMLDMYPMKENRRAQVGVYYCL
jgi:hypothetical protein